MGIYIYSFNSLSNLFALNDIASLIDSVAVLFLSTSCPLLHPVLVF